jgi:hypothetical protein
MAANAHRLRLRLAAGVVRLAVEIQIDRTPPFVQLPDEVLQGEAGEVPVVVMMDGGEGIGDFL